MSELRRQRVRGGEGVLVIALNHTQSIVKWGCQYCEQLLRTLSGFGWGRAGDSLSRRGVPDNTSFFTTLNRRQLLDKAVDTIVQLFNVLT